MLSDEALTARAFRKFIGGRKPLESEEEYQLRVADPYNLGKLTGEVERKKREQMLEKSRGFQFGFNRPFG